MWLITGLPSFDIALCPSATACGLQLVDAKHMVPVALCRFFFIFLLGGGARVCRAGLSLQRPFGPFARLSAGPRRGSRGPSLHATVKR